ncbi:MAG: hypothetical protein ACREK1_05795, partial [Longimicrobiales bacterium]
MAKRNLRAAWLLAMPLAMIATACSSDAADERTALRDDELARELDLALQADSVPGTFQDTVIGVEPTPDPGPAPRATAPRQP